MTRDVDTAQHEDWFREEFDRILEEMDLTGDVVLIEPEGGWRRRPARWRARTPHLQLMMDLDGRSEELRRRIESTLMEGYVYAPYIPVLETVLDKRAN